MNKRILLIAVLVIGLAFFASMAYAQSLPSGYDEDEEIQTISTNTQGAGTTFVQDLEEIRRRRIDEVIVKMRQGDPNVLRFIVYDTMEEVHREIIRRARVNNTNFYAVLNMNAALPSFVGGFDNQDPKVRLRCIGYLGDWVDEIGTDLTSLLKRTQDRLVSRIETRKEVEWGLTLLKLKIIRKTALNRIYLGDEKVLEEITADEFVPLVQDELFLRYIYCIPNDIHIRSIRLAPWWIDVKVLNSIVAQRVLLTQRLLGNERFAKVYCFTDFVVAEDILNREEEINEKSADRNLILPLLPTGYEVYRIKTKDDPLNDGKEFETLDTYFYDASGNRASFVGYKDWAGNWDIQSLYDLRYFNYSEKGNIYRNEDKILRAFFGGLRNRHLVVRENCARIIVMLSDPYVELDNTGRVIGVKGNLAALAKEGKYVETIMKAWEDVKYAQFVDVARPALSYQDANGNDVVMYYSIDGMAIDYKQVYYINGQLNPWAYCWNYRIDIYEILRRMGMGQLFDCDIEGPARADEVIVVGDNTYFVESLFDLTTIDVPDFHGATYSVYELIPDWHGVDEIEDEIFNPGN